MFKSKLVTSMGTPREKFLRIRIRSMFTTEEYNENELSAEILKESCTENAFL